MKIAMIILALLIVSLASAQVNNGVKPTDNNIKIPNGDIIRMAAQRPRDGSTRVIPDTVRRNKVNPNINAHTVNENSNAIQVDVSGQAKGTVASPIGSEPTNTNTGVKPRNTTTKP